MEKININKRVVDKINTFQVINDIIVPDIKPDIVSIIATNGIPYIYKQECENGRVKMDGSIDSYIVYLSVDGDTRSIQTTFNFSNTLEDDKIKEKSNIKYKINIDSIDAKVLNERKVSVVTTLSISYYTFEVQTIEITDDFTNNIPNLQKQEESVQIKSLVGFNMTKGSIKEDIDIENLDEIGEILKVNVSIRDSEQKISYNKILTKGECNVKILYMTEDNRIGSVQNTLPIMSFVDMENIKDGDTCLVEYNIKNMLFKINSREDHSITVQIDFEIFCEAYEEKNINILKDAYSLNSNVDISYKTIEVDNFDVDNNELIEINERIKVDDIKNVLDIEKGKIVILKKDNFNIEGEVNIILYHDLTSKNGLNIKNLKIPFISKLKNQNNVEFVYQNIETNLSGEDVILNIKLLAKNVDKNYNSMNIIETINMNDIPLLEDYNVVVYMVKKNDNIWNIAKKFKVTIDSIIKVNNLDNPDMIYPGDKLYILR